MASMQSLKRRIKSAKSIKQITKAMEMVAASKMRRAQSQATASRVYAEKLEKILTSIANFTDSSEHPLLEPHSDGIDMVVMFSTDKSFAGSLLSNLFRGTQEFLKSEQAPVNPHFIIVGQKARSFVIGNDYLLEADFSGIPDPASFQAIVPISQMVIDNYLNHTYRSVTFVYMDFISTLVQRFKTLPLLPFTAAWGALVKSPQEAVELGAGSQYLFEPNPTAVLNWLLPYYIEMISYQTLLECRASEHSARMVAMKNASDNATDIISDLTLSFNKQRQAKITNELLDNATSAMVVA